MKGLANSTVTGFWWNCIKWKSGLMATTRLRRWRRIRPATNPTRKAAWPLVMTRPPVVSVAATTGSDDGDFDHNLVGTVTDALSIRDYSIAALVGEVYYGLELVDVDAYDADPTTPSVPVEKKITLPFLGLQTGTGDPGNGDPVKVSKVAGLRA